MRFSLKHYCIFPLILCINIQTVLGECPLSTVPSPPIQNWESNVDALISAIKTLAGSDTKCFKEKSDPSRLEVAIPTRNLLLVGAHIQAVGHDMKTLMSEAAFYVSNSGPLLPIELEHQKSVMSIQAKIDNVTNYVSNRCGEQPTFETNVQLKDSGYLTKGRKIEEVLGDLSSQNTEVMKFLRFLITGIQSQEYKDETNFSIAPKGFAADMQKFYSADAIQKCHDEDPKNQAIMKTIKEAFTVGWKYPQAIKVWKDAWALLMYRSSQIAGSGTTDPTKEAQINNLIQAQKGGLGNSKFVLNSQFFKEFGRRGNNQTITEQLKNVGKRMAYELYGSVFRRQVINDVAISSASPNYAEVSKYGEYNEYAKNLAELDKSNYNAYARRKVFVGQNKEQDPKTVTGLVQALEELAKTRPTIEENVNLACNDVLNKQATNIPHPDCTDFMKG